MTFRIPDCAHDLDELLIDARVGAPGEGWNVDDLSVVCEVFEAFEALVQYAKRARALHEKSADALLWCSGSQDFQEGGYAELGWKRIVPPLLDRLQAETLAEVALQALAGQRNVT